MIPFFVCIFFLTRFQLWTSIKFFFFIKKKKQNVKHEHMRIKLKFSADRFVLNRFGSAYTLYIEMNLESRWLFVSTHNWIFKAFELVVLIKFISLLLQSADNSQKGNASLFVTYLHLLHSTAISLKVHLRIPH